MKRLRFSIILLSLVCCSMAGFCDSLSSQGQYGIKLNLQDASSVSSRANRTPSVGPSFEMNPVLNSQINGLGNMIQGMQGNTSNIYSIQEQNRLQGEYAKQQAKDSD